MSSFNTVVRTGSLVPPAHTRVVKAVMDNALFVLAYLEPATVIAAGAKRPSRINILSAALRVETIDNFAKDRIAETIEVFPVVLAALEALPSSARRSLRAIERSIDNAKSISGIRRALNEARKAHKDSPLQGLEISLTTCQEILALGRTTIYNPRHDFYQFLDRLRGPRKQARKPIDSVGGTDVKFGIGGGIGGCVGGALAGGAGCVPAAVAGAVASGIGASVAAVIDVLWEALDGQGIPEGDLGDFPIPSGEEQPA